MGNGDGRLKAAVPELADFEAAMRELQLMRLVINDLKSFKRMMRIRKYD